MFAAVSPVVQYRFGPLPYLLGIVMELRHLRYFAAVARELNFSRAAEKLHMAQPPLSRQIRELEDELGAELVDRSVRPLRLTPAGQFFHVQAQQLLERLAEVRAATSRIASGRRAWFGIGFVPSTLYGALPEVIRRFREALPGVEVGLSEMTTLQQIDALKAGRIDVGFGRLRLEDPRVEGEIVGEEPVVAALPAGHRLARRRRLSLALLASEPLLLYPAAPRPSYADQVLDMFRASGLAPTVALEANEMQTAIGLVVAGIGYALVPRSVQGLHREGVVYLPLSDAIARSPVIMNFRADDGSELVAQLRQLVRTVTVRTAEATRR
jgi:DNA-binding transcriptional LysR family regulator